MTFKRQIVDAFVKQSRDAGYKSRAAYKLLDLQDRFRIIKPGNSVLDLGCSPGSFLQVACQALGPRDRQGVVLGLDLTEVDVSKLKHCDGRAFAVQADASVLLTNDPLTMERFHRALPAPARTALQRGFDVVLSDVRPRIILRFCRFMKRITESFIFCPLLVRPRCVTQREAFWMGRNPPPSPSWRLALPLGPVWTRQPPRAVTAILWQHLLHQRSFSTGSGQVPRPCR